MRKISFFLLLLCATTSRAQFAESIFSKDPIIHLETWEEQRLHFGFFLGLNSYDFKFNYKTVSEAIQVTKTNGFNVGLACDLRLQKHINLRFEPGLCYTKRILTYPESYFPFVPKEFEKIREVNSTYIHFPLLLKFSSLRTGNIRPYLLGGFSTTLNLSSNSESKEDNSEQYFRVKSKTTNYELGFGIDIFSEFFVFSPSIRGIFGMKDELIRDNDPASPWTSNLESIRTRGVFLVFTFH